MAYLLWFKAKYQSLTLIYFPFVLNSEFFFVIKSQTKPQISMQFDVVSRIECDTSVALETEQQLHSDWAVTSLACP